MGQPRSVSPFPEVCLILTLQYNLKDRPTKGVQLESGATWNP